MAGKNNGGHSYIEYDWCPWCEARIETLHQGLTDRLENDPYTFDVCRCRKCGLVFTNPLPIGNLGYLYPPTYFVSGRNPSLLNRLITWYRNTQYQFDLDQVSEAMGIPPKRWGAYLDLGCGTGDRAYFAFTHGVKNTWGLDPFDKFLYQNEPGFSLVHQDPLTFKPKTKFSLVSLYGVFEHVSEVDKLLRHLHRHVLKPNGYLAIQVPNFNSLDRIVFGPRWAGFDAPRHLWHFSPPVLRQRLQKHGFKIVVTHTTGSNLHPITAAPSISIEADMGRINVINRDQSVVRKIQMMSLWAVLTGLTLPWGWVENQLKLHPLLTVVAQKI